MTRRFFNAKTPAGPGRWCEIRSSSGRRASVWTARASAPLFGWRATFRERKAAINRRTPKRFAHTGRFHVIASSTAEGFAARRLHRGAVCPKPQQHRFHARHPISKYRTRCELRQLALQSPFQPAWLCSPICAFALNPWPGQVFGIGSSALMPSQQTAEHK